MFPKSTFVVLLLLLNVCKPVVAADRITLMIMGDDSDTDAIPSDSRVFKGVVASLTNQMHDTGFDVYEESALVDDGYFLPGERRPDRDLIAIAKTVQRPPIDVVVLFTIYARVAEKSAVSKVSANVQARLLHVKTGRFLGGYEMASPQNWNVPNNCSRSCILESVKDYSQILAQDTGAVLAEKLSCLVNDTCDALAQHDQLENAFELQFTGFPPEQLNEIDSIISGFYGYSNHRATEILPTKTTIWYQTTSSSTELNRSFVELLKNQNIKANLYLKGNVFQIRKTEKPKKVELKAIGDSSDW